MTKKILITGGTGFVGSHVVEQLHDRPEYEVHVTAYGLHHSLDGSWLPAAQVHQLDVTDQQQTQQLLESVQPTHILHLAAFSSVASSFTNVAGVLENNSKLQLSLLESVKNVCPNARVLIVGSAEEYGLSMAQELPITEEHPLRPINPYAVSKVTQDLLAYSYYISAQLNIIRARPFNHIGERQSPDFAVSSFISQMIRVERGEQAALQVGNLEAIRDFSDVKDVVSAYLLLLEKGSLGEVYNIGSGSGVTMQQILDLIVSTAHQTIPIEVDASRMRPSDVPVMIADAGKMQRLGWQPNWRLEDTIQRIVEWQRTQAENTVR